MDNNLRDRLKQLIEKLKLPVAPEEVAENLEGLSDEEVAKLVEIYETVKKYQDELAQTAKVADPKKYAEIEAKYGQDLAKLDEQYSLDSEAIQEKKDHEMDLIEEQTRRKLGDLLYQQQVEYTELDDEHKKIYSKLTSALAKSA